MKHFVVKEDGEEIGPFGTRTEAEKERSDRQLTDTARIKPKIVAV